MNKLEELDIALDYPEIWNFEQIVRDLLQNFYDAAGSDRFADVAYRYRKCRYGLTLTVESKGSFDYRWLCYFGASTKTGKEGLVGKYGEGGVISLLNLVRSNCNVSMESQDWRLTPEVYTKDVAGREVRMLGCRIRTRKNNGCTRLTISGIPNTSENRRILEEARLYYYYPENKLIGGLVAETEDYAICRRTDIPIPGQHPHSSGIFFYKGLARGILPFPAVILAKKDLRLEETRERKTFRGYQLPGIVYQVTVKMRPEESLWLLNRMGRCWAELPHFDRGEHYADVTTWYYTVCQLLRNISTDQELSRNFLACHQDLVYLGLPRRGGPTTKQIQEARKWNGATGQKRTVQPAFRLLGVPPLLGLFQAYIEETKFCTPDTGQEKRIKLLAGVYAAIVPQRLLDAAPPVFLCRGFKNPSMFCHKIKGGKNGQRYTVEKIVLSPDTLQGDFPDAFLEYAAARFRAFGTDRSAVMATLLTYLGAWMYTGRGIMKEAEKLWQQT